MPDRNFSIWKHVLMYSRLTCSTRVDSENCLESVAVRAFLRRDTIPAGREARRNSVRVMGCGGVVQSGPSISPETVNWILFKNLGSNPECSVTGF